MKTYLIVLTYYICTNVSFSQDINAHECDFLPFNVALADKSEGDTNLRYEPNGAIVLKLNKEDLFVLHIINYKEGWLKVDEISSVYFGYDISNLEGWVHQSTVGFWTRKKINLLEKPELGKSVGFIDSENGPVKIKDICTDWVKIEFNGLLGWVELKWLCGNPVTTCP